jgi:hypothetical protein
MRRRRLIVSVVALLALTSILGVSGCELGALMTMENDPVDPTSPAMQRGPQEREDNRGNGSGVAGGDTRPSR